MLVVAVAMLGSVTVLPAVLSKLGDNVEKGRVPFISRLRHRNHGESRVWGFVIDKALKRPVVSVVAAGGVLLVLASPALNMRTINPGVAGLPHDLPIMQTYERIQTAFPGGPLPAIIVVQADDVTTPAVQKRHRGAHRDRLRPDRHDRLARTRKSRSSASRCRATAPTNAPTPRSRPCATRRSRRRSTASPAPRPT